VVGQEIQDLKSYKQAAKRSKDV